MSFAKILRLDARTLTWLSVAILVAASLLPALLNNSQVHADQITSRSIDVSSSQEGAVDVTYTVSFDTAAVGNPSTEAVVVQYCSDSPIVGDSCAELNSFSWFSPGGSNDYTNISLANQAGVADWQVDSNTDAGTLVLTRTGGAAAVPTGTTISFDVGDVAAFDGVVNPSVTNQSYYMRVITYATAAGAQAYVTGSPGTHIDDGGLALSTAQQVTINARVQEKLIFCTSTALDPGAQCTGLSGSTVDLGVLDTGTVNVASTESNPAYVQITTNASQGATISYIGDTLKVGSATCSDADTDLEGATEVDTDVCINYDNDPTGGTYTTLLAPTNEQWGMAITAITDDAAGATSNLAAIAAYDDTGAAGEYAFDANTVTEIANTTNTVASSEQLEIDFAATAEITTPTGLYSSTLTFIATSTF